MYHTNYATLPVILTYEANDKCASGSLPYLFSHLPSRPREVLTRQQCRQISTRTGPRRWLKKRIVSAHHKVSRLFLLWSCRSRNRVDQAIGKTTTGNNARATKIATIKKCRLCEDWWVFQVCCVLLYQSGTRLALQQPKVGLDVHAFVIYVILCIVVQ